MICFEDFAASENETISKTNPKNVITSSIYTEMSNLSVNAHQMYFATGETLTPTMQGKIQKPSTVPNCDSNAAETVINNSVCIGLIKQSTGADRLVIETPSGNTERINKLAFLRQAFTESGSDGSAYKKFSGSTRFLLTKELLSNLPSQSSKRLDMYLQDSARASGFVK